MGAGQGGGAGAQQRGLASRADEGLGHGRPGARPAGMLEVREGTVELSGVEVDLPDLSPGILRELMLRGVVEALRVELRDEGRGDPGGGGEGQQSEVEVEVTPLLLSSRLVLFPAYHINYSVGVTRNENEEKVPDEYEAMVGATAHGSVASERHYSGNKAAGLATAASFSGFAALGLTQAGAVDSGTGLGVGMIGGSGGGAGVLGGGSLLEAAGEAAGVTGGVAEAAAALGSGEWVVGVLSGVVTPEFGIFSVVFAAFARMLAEKRTRDARKELEDSRIREEQAAAAMFTYTRETSGVLEQEALAGGGDAGLRVIARNEEHEWRRWASADRWNWVPGDRRRWAESIYRQQKRRRVARDKFLRQLGDEVRRIEAEAAQEEERRRHYGPSQRERLGHGAGFARWGAGADPQGLYRALGIEDRGHKATPEEVKAAYRQAVMSCHPDRVSQSEGFDLAAAAEKFARVQAAYEVLRDAEKRRVYDGR